MAYLSLFLHVLALMMSWLRIIAAVSLARNHTEYLALLAIKSSITDDPQGVLDSWKTSLHFCQWQGVTCGHRHPRVTKLDLGSRGLVGSLPPQIGNLSFLRVIVLENNAFEGVIPAQIGSLFRLQKLIINNNSFQGYVPKTLSNCTRLSILGLASNNLVGKLPQELSSLVNLFNITIYSNGFTGGIPSFLGNFTFLKTLSATHNHLSGSLPHALGQLFNLQEIGFGDNNLYGTIPQSLCNLTSLKVVSVPYNQFIGSLPKDIGLQLPNLEIFQIWGNKFTGSIPFSFSNCSNLVQLHLADNGFTGKVNLEFSHMPNLRNLLLYNNILGDDMNFLDSMVNCSKLLRFAADSNQLTGVLPSSIGNLSSQLILLSFSENIIYGTFPSEIGNLVKLEILAILDNQLTGIIPSEVGNLQNLKLLYLDNNYFTGNLSKSLGNLSLLQHMSLGKNRLEGRIPPSLGNCRGLVSLDLSVNNLTGPIPIELFELSSLSITLNLSQNHIVGPLPQEIEKLKSLSTLDLSQNYMVGEIPNVIESCKSLEYLYLDANYFQGPIPPTMSALRGIMILNLSNNNFSGQIPKFLEQLNLSSLDLSFNNLDGEVPLEGIFKNASLISIDGNNRLCGGRPELRLPKCAIVLKPKTSSRTSLVIRIVIPIFLLLVLAMALSFLFYWKRRKAHAQPTSEASYVQPFSRVSYGSIRRATNEFSQQNLIGTGTFSVVYKGILEACDGMVAIKVLKLGNRGALKSFVAECEALKNIRHRNLVKVITSCSSIDLQGNDFKALIYEFMPNGNLEKWLHPSSEQEIDRIEEAPPQILTLRQRVTIATDVAHAMYYLHQECEVPIIHCDLKPSNILLDSDMVAHIGDFGLAKFLPLKPQESSSVGLRGTIGYAPPEYGIGGEMTKEGDIYSFGILLLEMVTGKRPTNLIFQEGLNLHSYVTMALHDRREIIEPTLLSIINKEMEGANVNHEDVVKKWERLEESMILLARIGLACSLESPKERMNTSKIIKELHHINGLL